MLGHGWLAKSNIPHTDIEGISFQDDLPTRWEEFAFVRDVLKHVPAGFACDAGSGYTPTQHVLPYILANLGWYVYALDGHPDTLLMPQAPKVMRALGDMCELTFPDAIFDLLTSISVIEHITNDAREVFIKEVARVIKPGGLLLVTVDECEPTALANWFADDFDVGKRILFAGTPTSPVVAWLVARRK